MRESAVAIKIENLTLGYGRKKILEDVSLEVQKESFCCVIGPNGCGKSTLLKAVSRNLKKYKGKIKIYGKPIERYPDRHIARLMAFLSQSPPVPEQCSVRELVSYGRFPHTNWLNMLTARDYEIVDQALRLTEMTGFAERELAHLSGGERQRAWIAMALAQEAKILLLDEPTTYLDMAHQFQTLELIHRLNREMGCTVLMVLHDLNQAVRYSDFLYVIKKGKIVARGKPVEIIKEDLLKEIFSLETRIIYEGGTPYIIPLRGIENKDIAAN